MQSVKSTQVQKPVLQTAIAPTAPQIPPSPNSTTPPTTSVPPPSYNISIQQKAYTNGMKSNALAPPTTAPTIISVPTTEPPSYASTMQAKVKAQRGVNHPQLPPPPYTDDNHALVSTVECAKSPRTSPHVHPPLKRKYSPAIPQDGVRSDSPQSTDNRNYHDNAPPLPPTGNFNCSKKKF